MLEFEFFSHRLPGTNTLQCALVLRAQTLTDSEIVPLALGVALDHSASMKIPMMQAAKRAAQGVVQSVSDQDAIAVVAFCEKSRDLAGIHLAADFHRRDLCREIRNLQATGGTKFTPALDLLRKCLNKYPELPKRILFLTDGQNTETDQRLRRCLESCRDEGIEIHAWGFGEQWDADELLQMAEVTAGKADFFLSPNEAVKAFKSSLNRFQKTAISSIRLRWSLEESAKATSSVVAYPQVVPLSSQDSEFRLGSLESDQAKCLLWEIEVEPGHAPQMKLEAVFNDPRGVEHIQSTECELTCPTPHLETQSELDPLVTHYFLQVELVDLILAGRGALARGQDKEALEIFDKALVLCRKGGNKELTVFLEELRKEKDLAYSQKTRVTQMSLSLRGSRTVLYRGTEFRKQRD
jgi:hypothetical protein